MIPMLLKFLRKPRADRRLLVSAAVLHALVAIGIRVLPFGWLRRALDRAATFGPPTRVADDVVDGCEARVVRAVRTTASLLPGATCLTEALVARYLLMQHGLETTLCFGVSRAQPADRPFDAHAWLERAGEGVIGVGAVAYEPLRPPRTCLPSQPPF